MLSDYDDYGRYKTEESGIKIGELGDLEDFVNFWDYGEQCKKDNKAVFLDSYGVLENSGSEFTERYNGDLNTILCPPSKNGHKKASKNEMNRSISLIYENRPHLFHGLLDNEPLPA